MYLPTTLILWLGSAIYMIQSATPSQYPTHSPPAASIPSSAPSSKSTTPTPSSTCTGPYSAANTEVPPPSLSTRYRVPNAFSRQHALFVYIDLILLPRATWATYCLDQCIAYVGNGTRICRSFEVNDGKPAPPLREGQTDDPRWYCKGYDVPLSADVFQVNEFPESYTRFLAVNRLCGNETIRDY